MRPSQHLVISTLAGGIAWAATGTPWALPTTIGAGVLIDIDHAPDIWWRHVLQKRALLTIILHSWEWLILLVGLAVWSEFPWWATAIVIGYGIHLATDHFFNDGVTWSYSIIYRMFRGFRYERLTNEFGSDDSYEVLRKELPFAIALIEWWRRKSARQ